MKLFLTILLSHLCLLTAPLGFEMNADAVPAWQLKKNKNGIKVYTRDIPDSNLKELKINMSFKDVTIPQILEILKDSESYKEWMYKCSDSRQVAVESKWVDVSYYRFDFPWPLSDRDAYLRSVIEAGPDFKTTTITTTSVPKFGTITEDIVRIENHFNQWDFKQVNDKLVGLTYYVKTDPGGNIPDWLVNLAVDKGPTNTLSQLRKILKN